MHIVYNWYPLQIGKIDYTTNKMDITEIKYNIPEYFETARGSTCGQQRDDEIWFVLHKAQQNTRNNKIFYNYQHFFAIFDLQMNLIRYSELFKLGDEKVEFCTGFIFKKNYLILSYSLLDTNSYISKYDISTIHKQLKWYSN